MPNLLCVHEKPNNWSEFAEALTVQPGTTLEWAVAPDQALERIAAQRFDLVIIDESLTDITGLELATRLIKTNPMINCVVASALAPAAFHEASEGLGVMMQLPISPQSADASEVLQRLNAILNLTTKTV